MISFLCLVLWVKFNIKFRLISIKPQCYFMKYQNIVLDDNDFLSHSILISQVFYGLGKNYSKNREFIL